MSTIHSLLARVAGRIVFACVSVLATNPPFSRLCLPYDNPEGLAGYFSLTRASAQNVRFSIYFMAENRLCQV